MKIKRICILIILALLIAPSIIFAQENEKICAVYFTYIGCPNCAQVDPIVLTEWTKKYPNLVVIEYMWEGGNWQDPNSQFFGEFAQEYKTQVAVPQLVFDKKNIRLGRIDVPQGEKNIKALSSNPCPLINKNVFWEDLDLNELEAKPKIWANGRILIKLSKNEYLFQWNGESPPKTIGKEIFGQKELKELLFAENFSEKLKNKVFDITEPQRAEFSGVAFPSDSNFVPFYEFENAIKINLSEKVLSERVSVAESKEGIGLKKEIKPKKEIAPEFEEETIELPIVGKIETEKFSLPILTFLIAIADGFNPCAFFILTFLLAALIGLAGTRRKILLVGGIFIFFSALFYFLLMSVLFNVLQLGGKITILTLIAGAVAVFAGVVNIKDYFFFQKGISLTLPKTQKEKFLARVKNLSLAKSTLALITATVIIAVTVNIYELLCTFGFPMVYARILTLRELPSLKYYLYLIFYNLIYVIPLMVIVLIFAVTLGKKTFSQIWVRRLKLVSGFMIFFLGLILVLKPKLLEGIFTAFIVLVGAMVISGLIILIDSFWKRKYETKGLTK